VVGRPTQTRRGGRLGAAQGNRKTVDLSIYADIYEFEPFWGVCSAAREQLIIAFVEKIARRKHGVQATEGVRIGTFGRAGGSDETETKEVRVTVVCLTEEVSL